MSPYGSVAKTYAKFGLTAQVNMLSWKKMIAG
jgi:hypothetical protein